MAFRRQARAYVEVKTRARAAEEMRAALEALEEEHEAIIKMQNMVGLLTFPLHPTVRTLRLVSEPVSSGLSCRVSPADFILFFVESGVITPAAVFSLRLSVCLF